MALRAEFFAAAAAGDPAKIIRLSAAGANARARNDLALALAAERGSLPAVAALCALGCDPNALRGLPLRKAAEGGFAEVIRFLLRVGANVHSGGEAALIAAIAAGRAEAVEELLAGGASLEVDFHYPFRQAVKAGEYEIASALLRRGAYAYAAGGEAIIRAAASGRKDIVRLILAQPDDPRARLRGDSPHRARCAALRIALERERGSVVAQLLAAGAEPPDEKCREPAES